MSGSDHDSAFAGRPLSSSERDLLRHHLAALAFRFAHATDGVPDDLAAFDVGHGVRTPIDLVRHVADVLDLGRAMISETRMRSRHREASWADAVAAVYTALEHLDATLLDPELAPTPLQVRRLLHGPLVDAGTHVGQLLVLRRLAGSPAKPARYLRADVQPGRLGPEQATDPSPDDA